MSQIVQASTDEDEEDTTSSNITRLIVNPSDLRKKRTVWHRDIQSARKKAGQSYIGSKVVGNRKTSVLKPAKTLQLPCNEKSRCRQSAHLKCSVFTQPIRSRILKQYNASDKTAFMHQHVKNQANQNDVEGEKRDKRSYFLPVGNEQHQVCAKMFHSTLSLSSWFVMTFFKQPITNPVNKPIVTRRSLSLQDELEMFFKSLPLMPSHYNRENSKKKYIQRDIRSTTALYDEYKKRQENSSRPFFKKSKFHEEFDKANICLYRPLKDRCEKCQKYELMKDGLNHPEFIHHRNEVSFTCW